MTLPYHQYYILLQAYLWPQWRRLFWLGALLLAGIGLQLLTPQLLGRFLDLATTGASLPTLTGLAAWVIGAVVMQQGCTVLAAYLGEDVAWTATNRLRNQLMAHCLHLDLSFHHDHTPGEMIERLDSDVTVLANFFSQFVVLMVGNLLLLLGVLALLFQTDWRIGLVGLTLAFVLLLTLARLRNLGIPYAAAHRQSNADLYAYLEERLGGIEEIRANGAVAYTMQRFYGLLRTVFHKSLMENWTHLVAHGPVYQIGAQPVVAQPVKTPSDRLATLEVQALHYHYPGSERGIHDISFTLPRGSLTIITGPMGAGKTTLLKVLLGLLPHDQGAIYWNGEPILDPATVFVPPRVAYTAQVPRLFSDTLRENILLGWSAPESALAHAIQTAVLEPDLAQLVQGLATPVGPRGVKLSGGQMQRAAAARMLVRTPELLVFDDLASVLDGETERRLWENLLQQKAVFTVLAVSHQPLALHYADQIIVMQAGRQQADAPTVT